MHLIVPCHAELPLGIPRCGDEIPAAHTTVFDPISFIVPLCSWSVITWFYFDALAHASSDEQRRPPTGHNQQR